MQQHGAWVGYHASHEMFHPADLLRHARDAERHGFSGAMSSDHFLPWTGEQGQSGHSWSWLGATLATTAGSCGVVTAPGQRMHPAIVAQAAATLEAMHPGRFWMALGSGEYLNEHVTGERWPSKEERDERLLECVQVMRDLFAGKTVTRRGRHVNVDRARLWTLPPTPPPMFGAALSPETAKWVASWADGLITTGTFGSVEENIRAFRRAGGRRKPVYVQVQVAWAPDEETAVQEAHRNWSFAALGSPLVSDLATPEAFEAAARHVQPKDVLPHVHVSADLAKHAQWLQRYLDMGADRVFVHNVVRNQAEFLARYGAEVLPRLRGARHAPARQPEGRPPRGLRRLSPGRRAATPA